MFVIENRVINSDILDILSDIKSQLTNGKLNIFRLSGSGIQVTCPHHAGGRESRPSCFINLTSSEVPVGFFHCFTCGESGSFIEFIAECFDRSVLWAREWLFTKYSDGEYVESLGLEKIEIRDKVKTVETYLDESVLDNFINFHPYMRERKLSDEVIKKFKIKYDPATRCLVFPVRAANGKLKYLTRRSVDSKKFIIDKGANKKDIYLLDNAIKTNSKKVYVCESQINALTLESWGKTAIATIGAGVTKEQIDELNKTDILTYVLCFDPDPAGAKGVGRFKKYIKKSAFVEVLNMPPGRDVNDLTREEFEEIEKSSSNKLKCML